MTGPYSPWDDIDLSGLHEVTDPAQVAILTNPNRVRFLRPFLARSKTITQASEELHVTPNALLYRVKRMTDSGLLKVVDERPRAGRPVKVYRSSHDGYRVPMSSMRYDDLRHRVDTYGRPVMDDLARAYTAALRDAPHHDRVLARNSAGDVWGSDLLPTQTRGGQPLVFADAIVWLDRDQARQIQRQIKDAISDALRSPGSADCGEPDARPSSSWVLSYLCRTDKVTDEQSRRRWLGDSNYLTTPTARPHPSVRTHSCYGDDPEHDGSGKHSYAQPRCAITLRRGADVKTARPHLDPALDYFNPPAQRRGGGPSTRRRFPRVARRRAAARDRR